MISLGHHIIKIILIILYSTSEADMNSKKTLGYNYKNLKETVTFNAHGK